MDRRRFVQFSVALASAALLHPQRGHGAATGAEDERLRSLLDTFLNQELGKLCTGELIYPILRAVNSSG